MISLVFHVCRQLAVPYVAATGMATATALALNNIVAKVSGIKLIAPPPFFLSLTL